MIKLTCTISSLWNNFYSCHDNIQRVPLWSIEDTWVLSKTIRIDYIGMHINEELSTTCLGITVKPNNVLGGSDFNTDLDLDMEVGYHEILSNVNHYVLFLTSTYLEGSCDD